jgi:hypothetical protein
MEILKYPSTLHIESSRHQMGDAAGDKKLSTLRGTDLVAEEKLDGSNSALSFDAAGRILLQSRGHYLTGGPRERHFSLFKTWGSVHGTRIHDVIGSRYVIYGEWLHAKHTIFYDALSHYWMEFDVFDRHKGIFLSTNARRRLLRGLPIVPVPVLHNAEIKSLKQMHALLRPTLFRTPQWRTSLAAAAVSSRSRAEMVEKQSDDSDMAEGLYLKVENKGRVDARYKYVRGDFLQTIQSSDSHWHDRPILENGLAKDIDIFAQKTGVTGAYDDPDYL